MPKGQGNLSLGLSIKLHVIEIFHMIFIAVTPQKICQIEDQLGTRRHPGFFNF